MKTSSTTFRLRLMFQLDRLSSFLLITSRLNQWNVNVNVINKIWNLSINSNIVQLKLCLILGQFYFGPTFQVELKFQQRKLLTNSLKFENKVFIIKKTKHKFDVIKSFVWKLAGITLLSYKNNNYWIDLKFYANIYQFSHSLKGLLRKYIHGAPNEITWIKMRLFALDYHFHIFLRSESFKKFNR